MIMQSLETNTVKKLIERLIKIQKEITEQRNKHKSILKERQEIIACAENKYKDNINLKVYYSMF